MIKYILNYKIGLEKLFIFFGLVWLFFLLYVSIIENHIYETNQINYLSFLSLCLAYLAINILNLYFKNDFVLLLNICISIFYLPKIFFASTNVEFIIRYLEIYPNFFTYLHQFALQYFILSLCIIVIFFNINFQDIFIKKNFSKHSFNLNSYTYILFFISLILIFQNFIFVYLDTIVTLNSFLNGSIYMILSKVFDVDIFVFLFISTLFFQKISKKIIFLTVFLFLLYIFNGLYILGNRSTPIQIILNFIFLMVLTNDIYKLKLKFIFFSIISLPIFTIYFSIAGAARKYFFVEKVALNCSGVVHCYKNNDLRHFPEYYLAYFNKDGQDIIWLSNFKNLITGLVDRISYFEFYLINMINADLIKKQIPLSHYFKSVVDKLSPGFDFYDAPLVKNLLYSTLYGPSNQISNSTQFTLFAENQIMFNHFYLILIIFFLMLFRFSIHFVHKIPFFSFKVFSLIFIYQLYWLYITGYGYDYLIVKSLYTLLFLIVFFGAIYKYEKK
jgi:hypothetical protein